MQLGIGITNEDLAEGHEAIRQTLLRDPRLREVISDNEMGRLITEEINSDPEEVARLRKSRESSRVDSRIPLREVLLRFDAEDLARRFHELYEQLAPDFGYETRKESAVPWAKVPEQNKQLMIAVCRQILQERNL